MVVAVVQFATEWNGKAFDGEWYQHETYASSKSDTDICGCCTYAPVMFKD